MSRWNSLFEMYYASGWATPHEWSICVLGGDLCERFYSVSMSMRRTMQITHVPARHSIYPTNSDSGAKTILRTEIRVREKHNTNTRSNTYIIRINSRLSQNWNWIVCAAVLDVVCSENHSQPHSQRNHMVRIFGCVFFFVAARSLLAAGKNVNEKLASRNAHTKFCVAYLVLARTFSARFRVCTMHTDTHTLQRWLLWYFSLYTCFYVVTLFASLLLLCLLFWCRQFFGMCWTCVYPLVSSLSR